MSVRNAHIPAASYERTTGGDVIITVSHIPESTTIKLASTPPLSGMPSRLSSCTLIRSSSLIKVRRNAPEPLAGHIAVLANCKHRIVYRNP